MYGELSMVPDLVGKCLDREEEVDADRRNTERSKDMLYPGTWNQHAHRL